MERDRRCLKKRFGARENRNKVKGMTLTHAPSEKTHFIVKQRLYHNHMLPERRDQHGSQLFFARAYYNVEFLKSHFI